MPSRRKSGPRDLPLELSEFLCFSVYAASHAFHRVYRPMLKTLGLTYPQFVTMMLLWEQDGRTVSELGRELVLESNTLTPLLKRLEAQGFVKRVRDSGDERQVRVMLTEPGRRLRSRVGEVVRTVRSATGLKDADFKRVKDGVDTLRTALLAATQDEE